MLNEPTLKEYSGRRKVRTSKESNMNNDNLIILNEILFK